MSKVIITSDNVITSSKDMFIKLDDMKTYTDIISDILVNNGNEYFFIDNKIRKTFINMKNNLDFIIKCSRGIDIEDETED